jgi:hypothetical protein
MTRKPRSAVREPVQVYLDAPDRELLDALSAAEGVPRTEVLRYALRQYGQRKVAEQAPGASLDALIGVLGDVPELPADYSERHDEYLYPSEPSGR